MGYPFVASHIYHPHPKAGEGNVFTVCVCSGGGEPLVSGPKFFPWSQAPGPFQEGIPLVFGPRPFPWSVVPGPFHWVPLVLSLALSKVLSQVLTRGTPWSCHWCCPKSCLRSCLGVGVPCPGWGTSLAGIGVPPWPGCWYHTSPLARKVSDHTVIDMYDKYAANL